MEFLYAVINFLILAALIFLFGRKPIGSMMENRRKKIQDELDAAEAAEKDPLPPPETEGTALLDPEQLAQPKIQELRAEAQESLRQVEANGQAARLEVRREAISDIHKYMVSSIREQAVRMFGSEPYASLLREREGDMVRLILSRVRLTPGDIAYLKTHDVLYVTLTSAFPLPEELVRQVGDYTDQMLAAVHGKTSFWVRQDPALLGGLCLRIGDTVYDLFIRTKVLEKGNRKIL